MTTSFQKLLTDCLVAMGDPLAATWSRTDVIIPWAKEAMLAFPILRPRIYNYTMLADGHSVTLPDDFREIISVEYPVSQEPPEYLQRLNRFDTSFYSSEEYYDVDRDFTNDSGWVCYFSRLMVKDNVININYLANHDTSVTDAGDSYITVPDEYVQILVQYVVCKGYRERLGHTMQDPTAHMAVVQQMTEMVEHAEARYQIMVEQAQAKLTDSRRLPHHHVDKYDRVY